MLAPWGEYIEHVFPDDFTIHTSRCTIPSFFFDKNVQFDLGIWYTLMKMVMQLAITLYCP